MKPTLNDINLLPNSKYAHIYVFQLCEHMIAKQ